MNRIKYLDFMKWKNSIKKTDSFLDIGCWSGATVLELNEKCDAYGADFNKETLKLAPKKIKAEVILEKLNAPTQPTHQGKKNDKLNISQKA